MADGHGGIQSISKTSTTGTNPVVDTYTITYADTTTSTFTVTNGLKGDTGARTYLHIKYSSVNPTRDADMGDTPDNYIGISTDTNSVAPTHYTSYSWFKIKGETGSTGAAASIVSQSVEYQSSSSGTIVPTGTWTTTVPALQEGYYLWTRTIVSYNSGTTTTAYSVGYKGVNGTGAGDMTKTAYDPQGSVEASGGIAAFVTGQVPSASQSNPVMDGTAAVGTSSNYARADHRHPSDTAKANTSLSNVSNGAVKTAMLDGGVVTAEKIATGAVSTLYTATVPANGWVEQSGAYINTVTVNGLLASDNPIIDWRMDGVSTYEVMQEQIEAWNSISTAMAYASNTLVVTAMDEPTVDIPIKILCIRK